MIIAIDGPAASGKGTLAKRLAKHLGFHHLDTGLLYRAVAAQMLHDRQDLSDNVAAADRARTIDLAAFDTDFLKSNEVGSAASRVAAYPAVRDAILSFQREFAAQPPGAVLDGRDIGSFVCPNAEAKFFVTAAVETRAQRRFDEELSHGAAADFNQILADLKARDERDATRAVAPMVQAEDAHLLDTTNLSIDEAFRAALEIIGRT